MAMFSKFDLQNPQNFTKYGLKRDKIRSDIFSHINE